MQGLICFKSQLMACFSFISLDILVLGVWFFFTLCTLPIFAPTGWAPHAYFQVLAEGNHVQSSSTRIPSLRLRQPEIEAAYMQPGFSRESTGNDCHSTSPILDAMENGRRFWFLSGVLNGNNFIGYTWVHSGWSRKHPARILQYAHSWKTLWLI